MQRYLERQQQAHHQRHWLTRSIIVASGFIILLTGIAMLVFPGPAIIVIPLGLGILSLEFAWARYLLAHSWQLAGWFSRHRRLLLVLALILGLFVGGVAVGLLLITR